MHKHSKGFSDEAKTLMLGIAAVVILMLFMLFPKNENKYYAIADKHVSIEIINSCDLTLEMLQNRNGKLIIEKVIGEVDNFVTGAGHILDNPDYYISYAGVDGISNGNIICSYMIYNPDNNYEDDIIYRFDYIIDARTVEDPEMENIFTTTMSIVKCN